MTHDPASLLESIARIPLSSAQRILSERLIKAVESVCERCEKDRMRLILNPACGRSRPLLTLLLLTRTGTIPRHCLEARLREIDQLARGIRRPDEIRDAAVPLDVFLSKIGKVSSLEEFLSKTKHCVLGDSVSFMLGHVPCIKLSGRDIVVVNPHELKVETYDDAISFLRLLAESKGISTTTRALGDYLIVRLRLAGAKDLTRRHIISALGGAVEHIGVIKEGENTTVIVDLRPCEVAFSDLKRLIESLQ